MSDPAAHTEEHELPCVEAVLAGTLALMTGYSQALQAELHPEHRLRMGAKIGHQLAALAEHPLLSPGFQQVMFGLQRRWQAMSECTAAAARDCQRDGQPDRKPARPADPYTFAAPSRLQ